MGAKRPSYLSTSQAAALCRLSQQTIIRACDGGSLPHFRIPDSRFRRIVQKDLYAFMRKHGIPVNRDSPLWGDFTPPAEDSAA